MRDFLPATRVVWRHVTRHPYLTLGMLALAALVVALLALLVFRQKEGWAFKADGRGPLSELHRGMVRQQCLDGSTYTQILNDPDWSFLDQYTRDEVWKACEEGMDANAAALAKGPEKDASKCKSGVLCPNVVMRASKPCANKDGTKCCDYDTKQCTKVAVADARNREYLADQELKKLEKTQIWKGCVYHDRVKTPDTGKWQCTRGRFDVGDVSRIPPPMFWNQCAETKACADQMAAYVASAPR